MKNQIKKQKTYGIAVGVVKRQLKELREKTGRTLPGGFELSDLIVPAFRYYLGRTTIATGAFAERLAKSWNELDVNDKAIIERELERTFVEDDQAREKQLKDEGKPNQSYLPLGWDCDRECWSLVRQQYLVK